jgi:hypothetical protein
MIRVIVDCDMPADADYLEDVLRDMSGGSFDWEVDPDLRCTWERLAEGEE